MKAPLLTYEQTLTYLYSLRRFGIKPGLERIERLLSLLSNPHKRFVSVLVGGTNGKGSVCAILSSVLNTAGYKTGLYTSPHLQRFTERIKVGGREIPEERVVELAERIIGLMRLESGRLGDWGIPESQILLPKPISLTFFEFVTAMAFLYFFEEGIDIGVIEVGMGGGLDATNVLNPLVSVITNCSLDHERFLGRRVTEIVREKGGIIKEKGTLVTGVKGRGLKVLKEIASQRMAGLKCMGRDFYVEERSDGRFDYYGEKTYKDLKINLNGRHQIDNAAIAIATLESLEKKGFVVDEGSLRRGLENVIWPGRLELVEFKGSRILLDSAHNLAGAKVLREFLLKGIRYKRLYFVIGIMKDKAISKILKILVPLSEGVILTQPKEARATPLEILVEKARRFNPNPYGIKDVAEAVRFGIGLIDSEDLLCITGSIFTIGEARDEIEGLISSL